MENNNKQTDEKTLKVVLITTLLAFLFFVLVGVYKDKKIKIEISEREYAAFSQSEAIHDKSETKLNHEILSCKAEIEAQTNAKDAVIKTLKAEEEKHLENLASQAESRIYKLKEENNKLKQLNRSLKQSGADDIVEFKIRMKSIITKFCGDSVDYTHNFNSFYVCLTDTFGELTKNNDRLEGKVKSLEDRNRSLERIIQDKSIRSSE